MIEYPERQLETFVEAGGDILNVHVEACDDLASVIGQIQNLGRKVGVAVSPETAITTIEPCLSEIDQVLVMGVNPGWGGQALIPETLEKISQLRALLDERGITADIEVDGGVKVHNVAECAAAGANVLVAGSVVFNDEAPVADNMRELRQAIAGATSHSS